MAWDKGWDNIFEQYSWGSYPPEELVRFIARTFGSLLDRKSVHVLEVGCGPGANICYLAREGYTAYGIDGSRVAINQAKERMAKQQLHAHLDVGDIMRLPYADESMDAVIDIECLYANTLEDSKIILSEIQRVLKPTGVLFSKTFMTGTHEGALKQGYGHIRYMSEADILPLYGHCFDVTAIDYIIRSDKNRNHEIKEWLISCQKR